MLFKCAPESFPGNSCFKWGRWPDDDNPGWLSSPLVDEKCDIGLPNRKEILDALSRKIMKTGIIQTI